MPTYGIYGNDYPAYKHGGVKYTFPYSKTLRDEPEWEYIVHESILNGFVSITDLGAHWIVEMILYIYKDSLDDAHDAADRIQDLLWNDTAFTYYRHSNGSELMDVAGTTAITFKLVEFKPFCVETGDYKDAIYIKFISLDYVKVVPTLS